MITVTAKDPSDTERARAAKIATAVLVHYLETSCEARFRCFTQPKIKAESNLLLGIWPRRVAMVMAVYEMRARMDMWDLSRRHRNWRTI